MIRARSDFMFVVLLYFTLDNVCNKMNVFKERTDLFICLVANLNVYVWKKTVILTKCALRRLENGNLLSSCWCCYCCHCGHSIWFIQVQCKLQANAGIFVNKKNIYQRNLFFKNETDRERERERGMTILFLNFLSEISFRIVKFIILLKCLHFVVRSDWFASSPRPLQAQFPLEYFE